MNLKCQVFTPQDYVEKLLDDVGYTNNLKGKRILENSCGDGNIMVVVVQRYIADCKSKGLSRTIIKNGLARDIIGVEIDERHCKKCIENLNNILDKEGIPHIIWQIYNEDFLRRDDSTKYEFIIGNPPYITYSEMERREQQFLNEHYESCKKGKFDYCYAFIEKSLSMLTENGKMAYLVPSSIFKTVFGLNLRRVMLPYISEIQDYTQKKVFDKALVKSAIVLMEANNTKKSFKYYDVSMKRIAEISKSDLGEKWVFTSSEQGKRRFGDYFRVAHVVATLYNDAFVLKDYNIDINGNYVCKGYVIEHELVRETATPRTLRTGTVEKIIFPYKYCENGLVRYKQCEIKDMFPGAYKYLTSYKTKLVKRNSEKNAKWFEYGRSQALGNLNREKCLVSTVISSDLLIYKLSKECIPYAGMYIIPKRDDDEYGLDDAMIILKSDRFKRYVEGIGIHVNGNSLRITSKDIENYMF